MIREKSYFGQLLVVPSNRSFLPYVFPRIFVAARSDSIVLSCALKREKNRKNHFGCGVQADAVCPKTLEFISVGFVAVKCMYLAKIQYFCVFRHFLVVGIKLVFVCG